MTLRVNYECPDCLHKWTEENDCACDSDCPSCGSRSLSPVTWDEMPSEQAIDLYRALRDLIADLGRVGDDFAPNAMARARRELARHSSLSVHIEGLGDVSA